MTPERLSRLRVVLREAAAALEMASRDMGRCEGDPLLDAVESVFVAVSHLHEAVSALVPEHAVGHHNWPG